MSGQSIGFGEETKHFFGSKFVFRVHALSGAVFINCGLLWQC